MGKQYTRPSVELRRDQSEEFARAATLVVNFDDTSDFPCSGLLDDVEIQEAIDYLGDEGGKIALGRGIFQITNPLDSLPDGANVNVPLIIEGKGCGDSEVGVDGTVLDISSLGAGVYGLDIARAVAGYRHHVVIKDLTIDGGTWWDEPGQPALANGMYGINMDYASHCRLENVVIQRTARSIRCSQVINTLFDKVYSRGGQFLVDGAFNHIQFNNCTFRRSPCAYAVDLGYGRGVTFVDPIFESNLEGAFRVLGSRALKLIDVYSENNNTRTLNTAREFYIGKQGASYSEDFEIDGWIGSLDNYDADDTIVEITGAKRPVFRRIRAIKGATYPEFKIGPDVQRVKLEQVAIDQLNAGEATHSVSYQNINISEILSWGPLPLFIVNPILAQIYHMKFLGDTLPVEWTDASVGGAVTMPNFRYGAARGATGATTGQTAILRFINNPIDSRYSVPIVSWSQGYEHTAAIVIRVGLYRDANNYIYFEFDTSVDANWHAKTLNAGVGPTDVDTGVTGASLSGQADLPFEVHVLDNDGAGAGRVQFFINRVLVATITTNIPAGDMSPYFYVETLEDVSKVLDLYYFNLYQKSYALIP